MRAPFRRAFDECHTYLFLPNLEFLGRADYQMLLQFQSVSERSGVLCAERQMTQKIKILNGQWTKQRLCEAVKCV